VLLAALALPCAAQIDPFGSSQEAPTLEKVAVIVDELARQEALLSGSAPAESFEPDLGPGRPAGGGIAGVPPNDTCETAIPVGVPSSTPGDNILATADQNIFACEGIGVLTVSGVAFEKGVWYTITGTGNTITVDTCSGVSSDLNTLIRVFCGSCSQLTCITANNTASPACVPSTAARVRFCSVAGQTYYIFVANGTTSVSLSEGVFTLNVSDDGVPCSTGVVCRQCVLECEPGDFVEPDPCGTDTNGGCNSTPPAFHTIDCGTSVCGNIRTFLSGTTASRDTDWYAFTLPGTARVTWRAQGEFPIVAFLIDLTGAGDTCPAAVVGTTGPANPCYVGTAQAVLPAGTHVAFVSCGTSTGAGIFTGLPCGTNNDYRAVLSCVALGACCFEDRTCLLISADECAQLGGQYQGDSTDCGTTYPLPPGPGGAFEDISGTGTQITTSTPGFTGSLDDGGAPVAIGFDFGYFSSARQSINVYTNGYLNFGAIVNDFSNDPSFPNPATPNDMIAPYWDDMDLRTQGTLHVQTLGAPGSRRFIAQWTNVPRFGATGSSNTFQAVLFEGRNCIEFRYGVIDAQPPASRTIGLENGNGTIGTNIDPTSVADGVSLRLCPRSPICVPGGACCLAQGCLDLSEQDCQQAGGVYRGNGTTCNDPGICHGACCLPDGSCRITPADECLPPGVFQGPGSTCGEFVYPPPAVWPPGFIDIIDPGNQLTFTSQDDGSAAVVIPFPFVFYGNVRQNALVSTNGYLTFGTVGTDFSNDDPIPNTATPNDCLYPLWDDLFVRSDSAVYAATVGAAPNRVFVVHWQNVDQFSPPGDGSRSTFQLQVHEASNCIEYHYANVATGHTPTIGVENASGTVATQVPFALVSNGNLRLVLCPGGQTCPQPVGACCRQPDGACVIVTRADCQRQCGEYHGDGSTCVPDPCAPPTGACCFRNGACLVLSQPECFAADGAYQGDGTACDPNPCGQPDPCAGFLRGDSDGSGAINNFDIDAFVLAISDPTTYIAVYCAGDPVCYRCRNDINNDGLVNNFDIDPFVNCLNNLPDPGQPCP
jgi:hypothetical protein